MRIAVCGGVYSNPYALRSFVADARARGAQRLYCLGDLGGYGAEPEAVWPLLTANDMVCIAGNYDVAIAQGAPDCGCGYADPRDREYAQLMYDVTAGRTSPEFAAWMAALPAERWESIGGFSVHFVHGSPLAVNDFWWESLSPAAHAARTRASGADVIFCTHSGLPWIRRDGGRLVVNVGVIGRPPNDGGTDVRYALADISPGTAQARIVHLAYDWPAQARSMRSAGLPEAFFRTNETGWWATCLEILPPQERSRGRYHIYDSSVPDLLESAGLPDLSWPDDDPAIPVRSLFGSPFLPRRIWLAAGLAPARPAFAAAAAKAGFAAVQALGAVPEPKIGPAADGLPLLELTVSDDGWHWHPAMLGDEPFLPPTAPPAVARQTAVRLLLEALSGNGSLSATQSCPLAAR